jgi:hypothetical protein
MFGNDILVLTLVVVSFLTWLVFVITACKFYKFFYEFEKYKSNNDVELNSLVWHAKKVDGSLAEVITEMRRANKLLYEISIGRSEVPEVEVEFKTEDILRHNKMDINKTPAARTNIDIEQMIAQNKNDLSHTSIDMEAIVAHNAIHKTAPPIAAALKNTPTSPVLNALKDAQNFVGNGANHKTAVPTPVAPAWLKKTPVNLANSVHNSTQQTVTHSPHPARHEGLSGNADNTASIYHIKNSDDLDFAHIPPPPEDPACKLSIDNLNAKSNQIDLKHLNKSSK